jgi:hypothetical protein
MLGKTELGLDKKNLEFLNDLRVKQAGQLFVPCLD